MLAGLEFEPVKGVKCDCKRLGHGCMLPGKPVGDFDEHVGVVGEILTHTAVDVHASDLDVAAAVSLSERARIAVAAVCVGVNDHAVSDLDVVGVLCAY